MRCPTCRRVHDGTESVCPRCQTDLAQLLEIESAGQALLARVDLHIRTAHIPAATATLDDAAMLLGETPEVARRRTLCRFLERRFPDALVAWLRDRLQTRVRRAE